MRKISGLIAASALVASVLFVGPAANAGESISAGGASYQAAIQKVCTASYTTHAVTYTSSSSGTGKTNFATGATQWSGTDSLYAPGTEPANFTYVPLLGGPVGIVFNVDGLTNVNLTPKLISDIFTAKITKWNDAAIAKVNKASASKLPDAQIQIVYRASTSGTTNNFANYMSQTVGGAWVANDTWALASGSTTGTAASGSAGIVSTVKSLKNSIGYVDLADAATAGLPFAAVQNGAKQFIKPTVNASKLFIAKQLMNSNGVVLFDYNEAVKGGYNLSLISYAVAPTKNGSAKTAAAKEYLSYFLNTCSPKEAAGLNYVSLSGAALKTANKLVARVK